MRQEKELSPAPIWLLPPQARQRAFRSSRALIRGVCMAMLTPLHVVCSSRPFQQRALETTRFRVCQPEAHVALSA